MIETEKADDSEVVARTSVSLEVSPPAISPLKLQPDTEQSNSAHYFLDELLRYHDRAFIAHVYAALARREPTETELNSTLDNLRSGRRGKTEIIESLLGAQTGVQPAVQVDGLPSPVLRRLSRWPVIGYVLRIFRSLTRIPLLIQDQQQFEAYALGQQQRIADYVNEVSADLQTQIHSALVAITALQRRLDELQRSQAKEAAGQREFLVQEQRAIVEAQKVAFSELQEQLRALARAHEDKRAELTAEVRDLHTLIEDQRDDAAAVAGKQKRKQV